MTREEAIYRLNNTAWLGSDADRVATENAVQMAIEALQAQATLDDVSNAYENGYQQGKFEATQKTGKWMTPKEYCQYLYETTGERCSPMATGLESFVYCSQCGEPSWFSKNYCPHCGARMECDEE